MAVFFIVAPLSSQTQEGLRLISSSSLEKIYEWQAPEWQWQSIILDGQSYLRPDSSCEVLWSSPGDPLLPMAATHFDLLPGQTVDVSLLDTLYAFEPLNLPLCPSPSFDPSTGNLVYRSSAEKLASVSILPEKTCHYSVGQARDRHIFKMSLFPIQYIPQSEMLRVLKYCRIRVQIKPAESSLLRPAAHQRDWTTALPAVKLYIVDEGPYQITGSALAESGISLSSIISSSCRLYNKGIEQPLQIDDGGDGHFDPEDKLLFYGRFRAGTDEYYDAYSDTNVYLLSFTGVPGLRYEEFNVDSAGYSPIDVFLKTIHLEQELYYYAGDSDNEIHNSERVSGEGWVWSVLNKGGSAALAFDLPSAAFPQDSIALKMRLRGTTLDSHSPDHHVLITINGTKVAEGWFEDRSEFLIEKKVLATLFRETGNSLKLELLADTPAERSQIYMDWFEIGYLCTLTAQNDHITFSAPSGTKTVFVSGFADSSMYGWDLARQRQYVLPSSRKLWRDHLSVYSSGYSDGNMAKLVRNGKEVAFGYRGHNLWRIDSQDGRLLETKNFDTYASPAQSDSMAAWIRRLPDGVLVAAAIRDEGTVSMTEAAHLALESLGSALTRSVGVRDSWALIGRKGAVPGTVPEKLSRSKNGPAVADSLMLFSEGGTTFSNEFALPADAGDEIVLFSDKGLKNPARISPYRQTDLVDGGAGADYIIISHPLFQEQAERLASYRSVHNGWRTKVVLIESIYDEFNFSLADPAAIRAFLKHTQQAWTKPSPAYVLLFGDASWDPKNHSNVTNPTEFVPTYGNPVSDSWFGCVGESNDILPDLHIGRIPVQSVEQAEASVDKIILYESTPSAAWKKNFLFISGGFDFLEQNQFGQQSANLRNQFVLTAPTYGTAITLNKTTDGLEEGEHRQDMLDAMNDGVCWVNFIGHAGSRTWDLMFHNVDIEALENSPRFPFITSMTCHTGRFAEPNQIAFGEHFLMVKDKGAIGFMGTSGWGYSYEDYSFLRKIFPVALKDTLRHLSDIIDNAKVQLWAESATNPQIRDMMYQYNLLGDPAVKLATPDRPDLVLQPSDIVVVPEVPSESDSTAEVKVFVHNYGLGTSDSVEVHLTSVHPNWGEQAIGASLIKPPIGRIDSLKYNWRLHCMSGTLDLRAVVDPSNRIEEADEDNNSTQRAMRVLSTEIQLLSPPPYAFSPAGKTVIRLDGSGLDLTKRVLYKVQLDTSIFFNSALLLSQNITGSPAPAFDWRPPNLRQDQLYFLRISDSTNNPGYWQISSFKTSKLNETGWRQEGEFGLAGNKKNNVSTSLTAALASLPLPLYAESAGYSDGNFARIIVGDIPAIQPHRGHNIVVVDPLSYMIEATRTFDTYGDSSAANAMAVLIEGLGKGKIVLAAIMDEGTVSMTERAYRALETIGSAQCRQVGARSSWAIIGRKGAPIGSVSEQIVLPHAGSAAVMDTLYYYPPLGTLTSPRIGPATAWRSLMAEAEVPQQGNLTLSLLGQRRGSTTWDTLRSGLPANLAADISSVSAQAYPYLQMIATFSTANQLSSPRLDAWQVLYDPAPDLAVTPAFLSLSADSVLSGQPVILQLDVFNIGLATADSVSVTFTETAPGSAEKLFSSVMLPKSLPADQHLTLDQLYTPTGKPGSRLITVRVDGNNRINELSESNNTLTTRVQVVVDTLKPAIEITFDGRTIASGDWVATAPLIQARLIDDSPLAVTDTLQVNLLLDGERIPFTGQTGLRLLAPPDTAAAALLQFTPQLAEGDHTLEILFADGSGNLAGNRIDFSVAAGIRLLRVMNYPNPMRETTDFTFELTQPAELRIRIYTVNGRLIRTLEAGTLGAGFNSLFWDGLDGDGDPIANGVYLYRIDAVSGSERAQVVEKCIVMR
jgi:hypothetical protein